MTIDFAPLEGLTDSIYRRVHHASFGGVRKYYMPFVSPSTSLSFTSRQQRDISPAANRGVPVVPQILARDAELFLAMTALLRDAGYAEVNLNLGCPSGTVTAKGKGAGMLRDTDGLRRFLDTVFARSPLPVSLKTRIGFDDPGEWPKLLSLFVRYPAREWILHPRTCREQYRGAPHRACYAEAMRAAPFPVIFNGDLFTAEEARAFLSEYPGCPGLMLGRGLAANPALAQEIAGGQPLTLDDLRAFHDRLYRAYLREWPENAVVGRMHGIMAYLVQAVDCPDKARKRLRRATSAAEYGDAAAALFRESVLLSPPRFTPP